MDSRGLTNMGARTWTTAVLGLTAILVTAGGVAAGEPGSSGSWRKTVIDGKFRSEGVAIADVNKDGKTDVMIGDSWYEAPSGSSTTSASRVTTATACATTATA